MHSYKKSNQPLLLLLLCVALLLPSIAQADKKAYLTIDDANFIEDNQQYQLLTHATIVFGDAVQQALKKGFELSFLLEFQLLKPRKYWFDDEIVTIVRPITVSYHPLSRQYMFMQSGNKQTFSSIEAVEAAFANLLPEPVFHQKILDEGTQYRAVVLLRLNYKKLPNDIQDQVDDVDAWQLSAKRYQWAPLFFK